MRKDPLNAFDPINIDVMTDVAQRLDKAITRYDGGNGYLLTFHAEKKLKEQRRLAAHYSVMKVRLNGRLCASVLSPRPLLLLPCLFISPTLHSPPMFSTMCIIPRPFSTSATRSTWASSTTT